MRDGRADGRDERSCAGFAFSAGLGSRELVGALPRCTFIFNGVYIFNLQPITLSYCPEGQTVCMSDVYIYI